jgi:hypothetical protein
MLLIALLLLALLLLLPMLPCRLCRQMKWQSFPPSACFSKESISSVYLSRWRRGRVPQMRVKHWQPR